MFARGSVDRKYIANYASLQVREGAPARRAWRREPTRRATTRSRGSTRKRRRAQPHRAGNRGALRNNNSVSPAARSARRRSTTIRLQSLNVRAQGRLDTPEQFEESIIATTKAALRASATWPAGARRTELRRERVQEPEPAVSLSVNQAEHQRSDLGQRAQHDGGAQRNFRPAWPTIIYAPVSFTRAAVDAVQHTPLEAMILAGSWWCSCSAHGGDPAARDPDLLDRHARGDVGVRLFAEQPVDVCAGAVDRHRGGRRSWWSRTPSGTYAPAWSRARRRTSRWTGLAAR